MQVVLPIRNPEDAWGFLINHFKSINLKRVSGSPGTVSAQNFGSNEAFWDQVLKSYSVRPGAVTLADFQVVDWYPRSPGLYHTGRARDARYLAEEFLRVEQGITFYDPRGKIHMIEGGIGTVRFMPYDIEGDRCWLCTATSDGYCHTGIPLAVPASLLNTVDFEFSARFDVVGRVEYLPRFLSHSFFDHTSRLPQIYVRVDRLTKKASVHTSSETVRLTPMVYFTGRLAAEPHRPPYLSGVTYMTCRSGSVRDLDEAADRIDQYVRRFGVEIVTNYDEQRPMFANAPFSLQNVMAGHISVEALNRYDTAALEHVAKEIGVALRWKLPSHIPLSGAQCSELQSALIDAFSRSELEQMVSFRLEQRLEVITSEGDLRAVTLQLIQWAQRSNREGDLVSAALAERSSNVKLSAFADKLSIT